MSESELRKEILFVYTILRDHLALTAKLESDLNTLLASDPDLRARYEAMSDKAADSPDLAANAPSRSAGEMLAEIVTELRHLSPPAIMWERDSRQ